MKNQVNDSLSLWVVRVLEWLILRVKPNQPPLENDVEQIGTNEIFVRLQKLKHIEVIPLFLDVPLREVLYLVGDFGKLFNLENPRSFKLLDINAKKRLKSGLHRFFNLNHRILSLRNFS